MTNISESDDLATRLHKLQVQFGLTVQQMADRCEIPKSSLESYMKLEGAKQPGLKALVSIADGMETSVDWLVGRTRNQPSRALTARDYCLLFHYHAIKLLRAHGDQQSTEESRFNAAASAMLDFRESVTSWEQNDHRYGEDRREFSDANLQAVESDHAG